MLSFSKRTTTLILLCVTILWADDTSQYGIGFIYAKGSSAPNYRVPKEGFSIIDTATGKSVGSVLDIDGTITGNSGEVQTVRTDYVSFNIIVTESKGDYLKLKTPSKTLWVSREDMRAKGFALKKWDSFLLNERNLYVPYSSDLVLRRASSRSSASLKVLNGHTIEIIEKGSGNWIKVKATLGGMCEGDELVEELVGWIEYISESGRPQIWVFFEWC